MVPYVYGTRLSYRDYLQAQSFQEHLETHISAETRSIIASVEHFERQRISIARDQLVATAEVANQVQAGFERLSIDVGAMSGQLQDISETLDNVKNVLVWGFDSVCTQLSTLNDSLRDLARMVARPSQTWAYEQYEIAFDAYRRGFHREALESLGYAIHGFGAQLGYKLEPGFHYLDGLIRLGMGYKPTDKVQGELVDPERACRSFQNAARSAADGSRAKAHAHLGASKAAYCAGKMGEAETEAVHATRSSSGFAAAHFQHAKVLMHVNRFAEGLIPLRSAIERDRRFATAAAVDPDFQRHQTHVDVLLRTLRDEVASKVGACLKELRANLRICEDLAIDGYRLTVYSTLKPVRSALELVNVLMEANTYVGCLDALQECERVPALLHAAVDEFLKGARDDIDSRVSSIRRQIADLRGAPREGALPAVPVMIGGPIISCLIGIASCNSMRSRVGYGGSYFTGVGTGLTWIFWGTVVTLGGGFILGLLLEANADGRRANEIVDLQKQELELSRTREQMLSKLPAALL